MGKKILKSIAVIMATFAASALCGIVGFGRQYYSIMPYGTNTNQTVGAVLLIIGAVVTLATSLFILRYFIFFTKTQVVDSVGNTLSDNSSIKIGSAKIKPIVIAAIMALVGTVFFGLGFGMMFNEIEVYIFYLCAIALIFLTIGAVFFLFSVIHHKIRRRFAWITSGVCTVIAAIMIINVVPAACDVNVDDQSLTAVTGTISSVTPDSGITSGPGKTEVVIKGTSGETITLRYSGHASELKEGDRYTFYYLPNTHFIDRVTPAENINIDTKDNNYSSIK